MSIPRISVIVPFLNAGRFLDEAVESVRAQSFGDWELILVDDGSQDESSASARRIAQENPGKVFLRNHPDGGTHGISASLNLGIQGARGEFVAVLDSDDVWFPPKLGEQVAILDARPEAAMVYGPSQFWWSWSGRIEDRSRDRVMYLGLPADSIVRPPDLLQGTLNGAIPVPCPSSILLRKKAVLSVGGFEEAFLNRFTDQAFYAKLFLTSPVFASARCWARYRQHPDSAVASMKRLGQRDEARRAYLEWLARYLKKTGLGTPALDESLREQLALISYRRSTRLGRLMRDPRKAIKNGARRILPANVLDAIRRARRGEKHVPTVGRVRFGDFRKLQPFSRRWGFDRGRPVDRHYIDAFLERRSADVRGHVMEIGDDSLTWRLGGAAVTHSDVLNVQPGDPKTTLVGDLAAGDHLPSERFDCIIFTETLHLLYDFRAGLRTLHRMLRPGGVLLATFPGITKIGRPDDWGNTWFWSFTELSARRVFEEAFPEGGVTVEASGNVLSATAFLWGLAASELEPEELSHRDPEYPVTIGVRAVKSGGVPQ